jgi:hypothetical protein
VPQTVLASLLGAAAVRARTGVAPLSPAVVAAQIRHAGRSTVRDASFAVRVPLPHELNGSVSLRIDISGRTAAGCNFVRTAIGSFCTTSS